MAITFIRRDWGDNLSIVRIITTDTLATVATAGYLTDQAATISQINSGPFTWAPTDFVLIYASDGFNFFNTTTNYTGLSVANIGSDLPTSLPSGYTFIGNASNIATGVNVTGDGTFANTGALTISKIGGKSISLGNSFSTIGNFSVIQRYSGSTDVTFPTTGTLATTAQATTYSVIVATTLALVPNTKYLIASPTLCTATLPVLSAVGEAIVIAGSTGGWTVAQNAGQNITWGDVTTLTGTGGSLSSSANTDGCTLICDVANTTWVVTQAQGNMTMVTA